MFVEEAPGNASASDRAPTELWGLPSDRLEAELCELAAQVNAGMARWIALIGEFDRREGWAETGCRSTAEWIAWRCALSPRTAREYVRVARALPDLPLTRRGFEREGLSYAKVRVLTRVATPESEAKLLELARHATASQLGKMLRAYARITAEEANDAHEGRHLEHCWDDDGSLCLSARLPAEEGALFLAVLGAFRAALRAEVPEVEDENGPAGPLGGVDRQREHPRPTSADAFLALAEAAAERGPAQRAGPRRHEVVLHVDLDRIAHDGDGGAWLHDGPALCTETARRLGCDASVLTVLERGGEALSVGRRSRAIPVQIGRAVEVRDRCCRFPGCERRRFTEKHHIEPWAQGGETSAENLTLLCWHHHRLVHEGGFRVRRRADGELEFRRPNGRVIEQAPPLPRATPPPESPPPLLTGTGEAMDFPACVDAVFEACG